MEREREKEITVQNASGESVAHSLEHTLSANICPAGDWNSPAQLNEESIWSVCVFFLISRHNLLDLFFLYSRMPHSFTSHCTCNYCVRWPTHCILVGWCGPTSTPCPHPFAFIASTSLSFYVSLSHSCVITNQLLWWHHFLPLYC